MIYLIKVKISRLAYFIQIRINQGVYLLYSLNKFTKNIDELKKTFQNKKTGVIDKFFEIY